MAAVSPSTNEYETAYLIMGHGKERPDDPVAPRKIRVPRGCAVVVDAHPGEFIRHNTFQQNIKPFFEYAPKGKEMEEKGYFLNPIKEYYRLTRDITSAHSLAIYREGEMCPNFLYQLIDVNFPDQEPGRLPDILFSESGLIPFPFTSRDLGPKHGDEFLTERRESNQILKFFEKSILPKKSDVEGILKRIKGGSLARHMGVISFVNALLANAEEKKKFLYTQADLFGLIEAGKLKPGVFYNLVCREVSDDIVDMSERVERQVVKNSLRVLTPQIDNRTRKKKFFKVSQVRSAIREAERHRKPFMKAALFNFYAKDLPEEIEVQRAAVEAHKGQIRKYESDPATPFRNSMLKKAREQLEATEKFIKSLEERIEVWNRTVGANRPGRWKKTVSGRRWTLKKDNND